MVQLPVSYINAYRKSFPLCNAHGLRSESQSQPWILNSSWDQLPCSRGSSASRADDTQARCLRAVSDSLLRRPRSNRLHTLCYLISWTLNSSTSSQSSRYRDHLHNWDIGFHTVRLRRKRWDDLDTTRIDPWLLLLLMRYKDRTVTPIRSRFLLPSYPRLKVTQEMFVTFFEDALKELSSKRLGKLFV